MTNRNLIVLIIGVVILIILVGGGFYLYQNKKQNIAVTPTPTPPAPASATPPKQLSADQLKANCLGKKENVKQFLIAAKNNDNTGNLLNEINATAVLSKSSSSTAKATFEQDKRIVFECYNTDPQKFKDCQADLGGLQMKDIDLEGTIMSNMSKLKDFYSSVSDYLTCKAVELRDQNVCSKFFLTPNYVNDCQTATSWYDFRIAVYQQPNCEILCQKDKEILGPFNFDVCFETCQAIKNSDLSQCTKVPDKNSEYHCDAFASLDPSYCQKIDPVLNFKQPDGTILKIDEVASCQKQISLFKAVKENDPSILNQVKISSKTSNTDQLYFLKNLYFGKTGCEASFDTLYNNYCNLKYSQ